MMLLVSPLVLVLLFAPQDPLEKRVATLLERLRADEIANREAAAKELVALGEPATARLEKAAADSADPETAARLKAVVVQIRRNALIVKVAPPVKLVTVSAKEVPLRDFLNDVCAQAGVEFTCDGAAGDRTVTVEARGEPLLQVVDRACAARGDVMTSVADGRLKVASGKFAADASAYAQGYRIRIRKTVVTDVAEAGAVKTSIVLYFDLDAQPDQKVRVTSMTPPRAASIPGGGEVALKGVSDVGARMGGWIAAGAGAMTVDGVAIALDAADSADRICLIKEAPAGLKKLESLKVAARFRYSVGWKPVTVPLTMRNYDKLPDIPYMVHFAGQQLYFLASDQSKAGGAPLEDFIELDSITLIGKDGKEWKATQTSATAVRRQYTFGTERAFQMSEPPQLRINIMDAIDRDVEFELRNVKLRD